MVPYPSRGLRGADRQNHRGPEVNVEDTLITASAHLQAGASQEGTGMHELPLIDPHHHLWNIEENYYPWLSDQVEEAA